MKTTTLAQWYGSDRMIGNHIAEAMAGCEWAGISFAGGMSAIKHIRARTIVANDLHSNVIALAGAVKENVKALQRELRSIPFHPAALLTSQNLLSKDSQSPWQRAVDFFVVAWMTRSGTAGTDAEKTAGLSLRWEAGGGDSAKRYHSAIDSLEDWSEEFKRCTFSCLDVFDFLDKCKDRPKHGIYADPPFIGECGRKYTHNAGETRDEQEGWHISLAQRLEEFSQVRIVVRAYDCEFVRACYPERRWKWNCFTGRKQTNGDAPEVLLVRGVV